MHEGVDILFSIGMPEVIVILVIALVVFGPGKLPEVGKAIGKGMNEFRRATSLETKEEPKPQEISAEKSDIKAEEKT